MRKLFLAFALIAATLFGGLVIERDAAAQNTNSSTTMGNMNKKPGMTGRRRHRRRRHRRRWHRRRGGNKNMNATGNKNKNMKM